MSESTTIAKIENPFGQPATQQSSGMVAAQGQREAQEVQAAMIVAQKCPRDQVAAMDAILNACTRTSLADAALYTYSRGGANITGPSIRLAEVMAQTWGNMQFGIRELEQRKTAGGGESVVQAYAWDMQTNVRQEKTFTVPHIRHTRSGSKRLEDPRDIYETVANQGARRLRACILGVIPGDVQEAAVQQCETTMHASADTSPEAMQKMVDAFLEFGVTKTQIEKRIQRRIDAIQPAQVVALRKVFSSLKDGMSIPADWFEPDAKAEADKPQTIADKVRSAVKKDGEEK